MKRKFVTIVLGIILLIIAGFSVALYMVNDVIASYTPALEELLSEKLGSKVSLGTIHLSLLQQEISTHSVSIAPSVETRHPPGNGTPLTVGSIKARANIGALLQKRLELETLTFEDVALKVVRSQNGIRISGLPIKGSAQGEGKTEASSASGEIQEQSSSTKRTNLPVTISLKKIELKKCSIVFKDTVLGKDFISSDLGFSTELTLKDNSVELANIFARGAISQIGPVQIGIDTLTSNLTNTHTVIEGGKFSLAGGTLSMKGNYENGSGAVVVHTDGLSLKELTPIAAAFAPHLSSLNAEGNLSFKLSTEISTVADKPSFRVTGPFSLASTNLQIAPNIKAENTSGDFLVDLSPENSSVSTNNLASTINGETITSRISALLQGGKLTVNTFEFEGFAAGQSSSPYNGSGTVSVAFNESIDFANQFRGESISIDKVARTFKPDLSSIITGTIHTIENEVFGELKRVPASLRAHGSTRLVHGAIKGVNLPGLVLKKVEGIPLLQGSLLAFIPPVYQSLFSSPDTPYSSITITYGVSGKDLEVKDLKVESDIFSLSGKGVIKGSGELDLDTTIAFTQSFSLALSTTVPQLRQILTAEERLVFPLHISGTPPKVMVTPNLKEVLNLAAQRVVKDKAKEILNKALDRTLGGSMNDAVKGWGSGLGF